MRMLVEASRPDPLPAEVAPAEVAPAKIPATSEVASATEVSLAPDVR